jgi:hypothetical protein
MKLRYKETKTETESSQFNIHALAEVLTGDDSVFIKDLDVWVNGEWKDMRQAFRDRDIIPNNENTRFGIPKNDMERERGYSDY